MNYRGLNITVEDCLLDTFQAASSIMCRGKIDSESYKDYLIGIKGLSSFLINIKFNAESASVYAAKVMYLSACILTNKSIEKEIPDQELLIGPYAKLNYLKKLNAPTFNMAAYAVRLIENYKI